MYEWRIKCEDTNLLYASDLYLQLAQLFDGFISCLVGSLYVNLYILQIHFQFLLGGDSQASLLPLILQLCLHLSHLEGRSQ